jgi:hypothetical protein
MWDKMRLVRQDEMKSDEIRMVSGNRLSGTAQHCP